MVAFQPQGSPFPIVPDGSLFFSLQSVPLHIPLSLGLIQHPYPEAFSSLCLLLILLLGNLPDHYKSLFPLQALIA